MHNRVPRQNIGVKIPGYTVTDTMKACATKNITTQAQSFALRVSQTLGTEAPALCIDARPGLTSSTLAQTPFGDPTSTATTELEVGTPIADEGHTRPILQKKGSSCDTLGISKHNFAGKCCPGCACNDCMVTLGGNRGKYCITCYKDSGLTFCKHCHDKRQTAD